MIIRDVQNQVFNSITHGLDEAGKAKVNAFRANYKNDAEFIRFLQKSNADPAKTIFILNDLAEVYEVLDNGQEQLRSFTLHDNGKISFNKGFQLDARTLNGIAPADRSTVIQGLQEFNGKQIDIFNQLRTHINDDVYLFKALAVHSDLTGCTFKESVGTLLKFFNDMQPNSNTANVKGGLVVPNGQIQTNSKFLVTSDHMQTFERRQNTIFQMPQNQPHRSKNENNGKDDRTNEQYEGLVAQFRNLNLRVNPVDWRLLLNCSANQVRNQGSQGICWLMTGVNALEYAHRIHNNTDIIISERDLLRLLRKPGHENSGSLTDVWENMRKLESSGHLYNKLSILGKQKIIEELEKYVLIVTLYQFNY